MSFPPGLSEGRLSGRGQPVPLHRTSENDCPGGPGTGDCPGIPASAVPTVDDSAPVRETVQDRVHVRRQFGYDRAGQRLFIPSPFPSEAGTPDARWNHRSSPRCPGLVSTAVWHWHLDADHDG